MAHPVLEVPGHLIVFGADQCHLFAWAQNSPSLSRSEGAGITKDRTKNIWSISSPDFIIFNYTEAQAKLSEKYKL